jgi:hypothetical protein
MRVSSFPPGGVDVPAWSSCGAAPGNPAFLRLFVRDELVGTGRGWRPIANSAARSSGQCLVVVAQEGLVQPAPARHDDVHPTLL